MAFYGERLELFNFGDIVRTEEGVLGYVSLGRYINSVSIDEHGARTWKSVEYGPNKMVELVIPAYKLAKQEIIRLMEE